MNASFLATVAYAMMALAMTFLANLIGYMATGSTAHQLGLVLTITATAAAYLSQSNFTAAAEWLSLHTRWTAPNYAGPADPDAYAKHQRHQKSGTLLQMAAIGAAAIASGCFVVGAL